MVPGIATRVAEPDGGVGGCAVILNLLAAQRQAVPARKCILKFLFYDFARSPRQHSAGDWRALALITQIRIEKADTKREHHSLKRSHDSGIASDNNSRLARLKHSPARAPTPLDLLWQQLVRLVLSVA